MSVWLFAAEQVLCSEFFWRFFLWKQLPAAARHNIMRAVRTENELHGDERINNELKLDIKSERAADSGDNPLQVHHNI